MGVMWTGRIGAAEASVEFTVNASNVVTGITIRSTLPCALRVRVAHAGSGYVSDSEYVLTAPLTLNVPNPRRFPDDFTADVVTSTNVRSVP